MEKRCDSGFEHCLYFTANSLARRVSRMADEAFMVTGLAPSYAFVQMVVNEQPGVHQNEISTRMNLAPSTVTRFIDKLEERGLIRREAEGKASHIYPTPKGLELQGSIEKAWAGLHKQYVAALGEEFTRQLTEDICLAHGKFEG